MDKTKKILLILLVSFLSIVSTNNTYAEEVDMSFLADILNGNVSTNSANQAPATPSNNSYTSEAMYQAQNSNVVINNNSNNNPFANSNANDNPFGDNNNVLDEVDYNYNPFANSNSNNSLAENAGNVAVNKLPQTGAEHALLVLLSITMAGFVFYKKRNK